MLGSLESQRQKMLLKVGGIKWIKWIKISIPPLLVVGVGPWAQLSSWQGGSLPAALLLSGPNSSTPGACQGPEEELEDLLALEVMASAVCSGQNSERHEREGHSCRTYAGRTGLEPSYLRPAAFYTSSVAVHGSLLCLKSR